MHALIGLVQFYKTKYKLQDDITQRKKKFQNDGREVIFSKE